jgi:hypothetical protein
VGEYLGQSQAPESYYTYYIDGTPSPDRELITYFDYALPVGETDVTFKLCGSVLRVFADEVEIYMIDDVPELSTYNTSITYNTSTVITNYTSEVDLVCTPSNMSDPESSTSLTLTSGSVSSVKTASGTLKWKMSLFLIVLLIILGLVSASLLAYFSVKLSKK